MEENGDVYFVAHGHSHGQVQAAKMLIEIGLAGHIMTNIQTMYKLNGCSTTVYWNG